MGFEDVDQMGEKLKPKGTAEAFLKAHKFFQDNKDKEPEDERPAPMTAAEWRKILDEQDDETAEFGLMGVGKKKRHKMTRKRMAKSHRRRKPKLMVKSDCSD